MRADQCYFCKSRSCYHRIVSSGDNGAVYDEVACNKHISELEKHSDEVAPKVMKLFQSSTGLLKRRVDITAEIKEMEGLK